MDNIEAFKPTIKSAIMYEEITGNDFFSTGRTDDDVLVLMYCVYSCTVSQVSLNAFMTMMENKKFAMEMATRWKHYERFMRPFEEKVRKEDEGQASDGDGGDVHLTMKEVAQLLVFKYGLEPDYVFNRVELWEMNYLIKIGEGAYRNRKEEERLWTFMQVAPHLDPKKAKDMTPTKFFPFAWEDDIHTKAGREKALENETGRMKKTIGHKLFAQQE